MGSTDSRDTLLDGRVVLHQPGTGYRVAIDPVFLAAAVPTRTGERILDAGAGSGAAALCLARRQEGCRVVGLELDGDLVRLATRNAAANGLSERVVFIAGDVLQPPPDLRPGSFDHVMANPPHHEAERVRAPPHEGRARALVEGEADLEAWIAFCFDLARDKGSVTLIHRADRLAPLLRSLARHGGEIVLFPLWPKAGGPAKRVIVRARKGVATPLRLAAGLVLHDAGGRFSAAADEILRRAAALVV